MLAKNAAWACRKRVGRILAFRKLVAAWQVLSPAVNEQIMELASGASEYGACAMLAVTFPTHRRPTGVVDSHVWCRRHPSPARRSCVEMLGSLAPPGLLDEWLELADGYRGQVNENGGKPIVVRLREELCRGQGE